MKLLQTANKLSISRPHEDATKIAHRTRDLFAEVLKRTIGMPTIDGKPVFVNLRHFSPEGDIQQTSSSPAEAMENYDRFNGVAEQIGARSIQVDMPIPARRDLPTSASRLRVEFHAPSGNPDLYGYDLTAYKPPVERSKDFDPTSFQPPRRLHFRDDNVRHQLLIRGDVRNPGDYNIRTAMQSAADVELGIKTYAYLDQENIHVADALRVLPELTRQEEQILDLGAHTLAYCQLRQDLSIMSALAGQDPAHPMGVY